MSERNLTLIRIEEVLKRTGLCERDLAFRLRDGRFPKPIPLGIRTLRWLEHEVDAWTDSPEAKGRALYFIYSETIGLMKIGVSSDPRKRRRNLENASGVLLQEIGVLAGGEYLERPLHEALSHYRVRGEWFQPTREVWDLARAPSHDKVNALILRLRPGIEASEDWKRSLREALKIGRQMRREYDRIFPTKRGAVGMAN